MRRTIKILGVALAIALITAACGGDGGGTTDTGQEGEENLEQGGTLRAALLSDVSAAFDPQKEYYSTTWMFYRCCLLRTLMSYPGLPGDEGGSEVIPDLASEEPTVSEDGLTWTFTMQEGLMYAPPFQDTEIVAGDIVRALEREADPEAAANGYSFYYSVIEGFDEFSDGKADSISGLNAPDDYTLEVTLNEPAGDLPYRMAMHATAPIPEGAADGHVKDYGRYLVASGPYMFEGSEDLDFSAPPGDQKPVSGYQPGKSITLVRNPSFDPGVNDFRPAYPDRMEITIGGTEEDIANKIDAGEIDINLDGVPPPQQLRDYQTDPELKDQVYAFPSDAIRYLSFNLAEPPFDDLNVRKAVSFALNKEAMRRLRGGPLFGEIAGHIILNTLEDDILADYDPYGSEGAQGDIDAAKEAMSQSKYDTDGDGVCDDPVCEDVLSVTDEADPYPDQAALITDNLEPLGITLDVKQFERTTMYDKCLDPSAHTAFCLAPGWGKDYADATTFAEPLFGAASLGPDACCNYSLVGASPEHLKKYDYEVTEVPGADEQISECEPLTGDERLQCWADFDTYLMEEVVPWVPYLFDNNVDIVSTNVVSYSFDQFAGSVAPDRIALSGNS
ncbi:MAG: ABC transporter substrate-binding protein [Actinomycetota bacterium]